MLRKILMTTISLLTISSGIIAQENQFGFGLILGEPIAFNAKLWVNQSQALNFALGWNIVGRSYGECWYEDSRCYEDWYYRNNRTYCDRLYRCDGRYFSAWRSIHFHIDYLFHHSEVFNTTENVAMYFGSGMMLNFSNNEYQYRYRDRYYSQYRLGIRFPVGFDWVHSADHFNLFFELAPVLIFVPRFNLILNGGLGVRYFL
ncbi:hypothetical protein CHISP_2580 [Chitinispirillum alkaliphilum]|nr:hypothetical protein CHISP_2580 [Chitinispirillum alkaliphilum]